MEIGIGNYATCWSGETKKQRNVPSAFSGGAVDNSGRSLTYDQFWPVSQQQKRRFAR